MQVDVSTLALNGFAYAQYPEELRIAVEKAVNSWKLFCALPDEQKLRFGYDPDAKTSGNGYELKKVPGTKLDQKEDTHLRVVVRDSLMRRAHQVDEVYAPQFVEDALALNPLMAELLYSFGRGVEEMYGVKGFADDILAKQPQWLLRFLHYFAGAEEGQEIAAGHVDKGGFTLHLYETRGGVERLTYDTKQWKPLPLSHDQTVIFPGMGLQQRSRGVLQGMCHRVVATKESAVEGRYSAVCFLEFANCRYYNKTKFGRTQDWEPGFNYNMPFDEFNRLFID